MIITIEGTDGSGKETQSKKLLEALEKMGYNVKLQSFPNYESDSSFFVKKYLNGDFGGINSLSSKQSSVFFAIDRMCTMRELEEFLQNDGILILDRYVSSNILHQASKIEDETQRDEFINWLENFEYNDLELPVPDVTIFLNMPIEITKKLRENRQLKAGTKKDIHEDDEEYLHRCYSFGMNYAKKAGWKIVDCSYRDEPKEREIISNEILEIVNQYIVK